MTDIKTCLLDGHKLMAKFKRKTRIGVYELTSSQERDEIDTSLKFYCPGSTEFIEGMGSWTGNVLTVHEIKHENGAHDSLFEFDIPNLLKVGYVVEGEGIEKNTLIDRVISTGPDLTNGEERMTAHPIEKKTVASVVASWKGEVLRVSKVNHGLLTVGQHITADGLEKGTRIEEVGNYLSGVGGTGTYVLSDDLEPKEVSLRAVLERDEIVEFTGSWVGSTLTVSCVPFGVIRTGQKVTGEGILEDTMISEVGKCKARAGGPGVYKLSKVQNTQGDDVSMKGVKKHIDVTEFVGSWKGSILKVHDVASGRLEVGQTVEGEGISDGTTLAMVVSLNSRNSSTGVYKMSVSQACLEKEFLMKAFDVIYCTANIYESTLEIMRSDGGVVREGQHVFAETITKDTTISSHLGENKYELSQKQHSLENDVQIRLIDEHSPAAIFKGYWNGNLLTVSSIVEGTISVGQIISGQDVKPGTFICGGGSLYTGQGDMGTYRISPQPSSGVDVPVFVERDIITAGLDFKDETIRLAVGRCKDRDVKFCSHELTGLDPGNMYRFRITGINEQVNDTKFFGTYSGSILNVLKVISGEVKIGQKISGEGIVQNTTVQSMGNFLSGMGREGTYTLSEAQKTVDESSLMKGRIKNRVVVEFMATCKGSILTVSKIIYGEITIGQIIIADVISRGTSIVDMGNDLTGRGGSGTYELSMVQPNVCDTKMNFRGFDEKDLIVRLGPPSEASYTACTNAGEPDIPDPPFIARYVQT